MDEVGSGAVTTSKSISILFSLGIFMGGLAALIVAASVAIFVVYYVSPGTKTQVNENSQSDFQLIQLGDMRRDQFLLDKHTGRVWKAICFGKASGPDCRGMMIWKEMYVESITPNDSPATSGFKSHISEETEQKKPDP